MNIKIGEGVKEPTKLEKEVKEKESGSKLWVILILIASVIASLVFSLKKGMVVEMEGNQEKGQVEEQKKKGGLFGPAEYEFGK